VITFTGGEESDVLHAAGTWMAENLYAVIVALNWRGNQTEEGSPRPQWRMDMVVDMSYYHTHGHRA
jgi:hypothetical protein